VASSTFPTLASTCTNQRLRYTRLKYPSRVGFLRCRSQVQCWLLVSFGQAQQVMSRPGKVVVPYVPQSELQGEIENGPTSQSARSPHTTGTQYIGVGTYRHRAFGFQGCLLMSPTSSQSSFPLPSPLTRSRTHTLTSPTHSFDPSYSLPDRSRLQSVALVSNLTVWPSPY
jgi:hypothetical protein